MAKLFIVESPGKLKTLRKILGQGWDVQPSVGHITELAHDGEDSLGFDLGENAITCRYIPRGDRGKEVIQKLRNAAKNAQEVYLATDPDREGEAIAWHIAQQLKLNQPKRVVYSQITEQAVKKALETATTLDHHLIDAQRCRQCLDKLVGYRVSPLLWNSTGGKSAGRVQSATLHLVCQREREITAFVPQNYWSVWVDYALNTATGPNERDTQPGNDPSGEEVKTFRAFYKGKATSLAKKSSSSKTKATETQGEGGQPEENEEDDAKQDAFTPESVRVLSEEEANALVEMAKSYPHHVIRSEGKATSKSPPPPFITSSLQQSAGSQLGMNPEKTMSVAQSLYEGVELADGPKGLITYMRTDSVDLSPEFVDQVRDYLGKRDPKNLPSKQTKHKVKDSAQAAHEAIRPTDVFITPKSIQSFLSPEQYGLYALIWRRAVASLSAPAKLIKSVILTQSQDHLWEARGMVVDFPGYTFYWNNLEKGSQLPQFEKNQEIPLYQAGHDPKQTQAPSRYSEAKLVQLMEKKGIGRPSTYASTLKTLKERFYIDLKGKVIHPTELGMGTDQVLSEVLPNLVSSDFTAAMESQLDAIAEGKQPWETYLIDWNKTYLQPELIKAREAIKLKFPNKLYRSNSAQDAQLAKSRTKCPQCEAPLSKVPLKKLAKGYFLKCTNTCSDLVMFWSDRESKWVLPQPKFGGGATSQSPSTGGSTGEAASSQSAIELTLIPCPVCQKPMEIYPYVKDGQSKQLLRCSDPVARVAKKHADAVYFQSKGKWWSPKHGEIPQSPPSPPSSSLE
ncbi:MAG: type I DNA topoisomerase [Cyanobacteria bacterium]|nr:type I DNA topoisomerase [Cyanobacteriota bacterium]